MIALDLYCKAGGAARGLAAAGFEVVGVDIEPQPNYPYDLRCFDVRIALRRLIDGLHIVFDSHTARARALTLRDIDFIWASPPCLDNTPLKHAPGGKQHVDLIAPTRDLLIATGKPYVIENVVGARARLRDPYLLCGTMFGLSAPAAGSEWDLQRHRLFETSWPLLSDCPPCRHLRPVLGVYGGHVRNRAASAGGRGTADLVNEDRPQLAARLLGLPEGSMTMDEYSNAIPPAYAEWIARDFLRWNDDQAD